MLGMGKEGSEKFDGFKNVSSTDYSSTRINLVQKSTSCAMKLEAGNFLDIIFDEIGFR